MKRSRQKSCGKGKEIKEFLLLIICEFGIQNQRIINEVLKMQIERNFSINLQESQSSPKTKAKLYVKIWLVLNNKMIQDVQLEFELEDENDYEMKNVIDKTKNIDSHFSKEQFKDWVAINNAHKKVLSYKFHSISNKFSKNFSSTVANYLKENQV